MLEHERHLGRLLATRGGLRRLDHLYRDGVLMDEMWKALRDDYNQERKVLGEDIMQLFAEHAELERELLLQARREARIGSCTSVLNRSSQMRRPAFACRRNSPIAT